MLREQLKAAYLDWRNNYLTVAVFAEHNQIGEPVAREIIAAGKRYHDADAEHYAAVEARKLAEDKELLALLGL